jgi:hypothetical protein
VSERVYVCVRTCSACMCLSVCKNPRVLCAGADRDDITTHPAAALPSDQHSVADVYICVCVCVCMCVCVCVCVCV